MDSDLCGTATRRSAKGNDALLEDQVPYTGYTDAGGIWCPLVVCDYIRRFVRVFPEAGPQSTDTFGWNNCMHISKISVSSKLPNLNIASLQSRFTRNSPSNIILKRNLSCYVSSEKYRYGRSKEMINVCKFLQFRLYAIHSTMTSPAKMTRAKNYFNSN